MAALVKYKYLGLSSVVEVDYPTPQVKLDLHGGTPGTYTGLDRFGRVINHPWINYGATPDEDVARIQHGYDRNSNRLWRQNDVARALSKKFDQQYTYDGLNRLTDAKTGLLNGSHVIPSGSDTAFEQKWSLDYVGNWSCFKQDDDGGGTFDLEQTRTANPVNEITNISATTGPTWTTPQYDPAGNTTSFPKPAAPTESFTAVYDAWNRMVKVIDNETDDIVQENVYDGRNFRVIKKTYAAGVLDETRHIYYTSSWQAVEERLGTSPDSADPAQQYVWGIRYIDDLVLRDRDTSLPPDGALNERLYAIQDPNWNVTTIIDDSGDVQQRYEYAAYGKSIGLTASFSPQLVSSVFAILYSGYSSDDATCLLLARNRFHHPLVGRWLQWDPIGYLDSFNLYEYVSASPLTMTDPTGEGIKDRAKRIESYLELGATELAAKEAGLLATDFVSGGRAMGYPNAAKFMNHWINKKGGTYSLDKDDFTGLFSDTEVMARIADQVVNVHKLTGGPQQVSNLVLKQITATGASDWFMALGWFHLTFTGTYCLRANGTLELEGDFTISDTYDWQNPGNKYVTIQGVKIYDKWFELTEDQGFAKAFSVGGTSAVKYSYDTTKNTGTATVTGR